MTDRFERISYVIAFSVVGVFFLFLLVVGIQDQLFRSGLNNNDWFSTPAFAVGFLMLSCLKLFALLLLVSLSIAGLVVVRRKSGAADQVQSLVKLVVVSLLLLAAEVIIFADLILRSDRLGVSWIVPVILVLSKVVVLLKRMLLFFQEWFSALLVQCIAVGLQSFLLLFVATSGAMSLRSAYPSGTGKEEDTSTMGTPLLEAASAHKYDV